MLFAGFLLGFAAFRVYKIKKEEEERKAREELEQEIIEGLIELKKYTTPDIDGLASDKYDLLEVALENDISDVTIATEEGFPIVSTLKNPEEDAAKYSALFQYINNNILNDLLKINLKSENGYRYVIPIVKENEKLYIILKSNIEIDNISEKKIVKDILNLLDKYMGNL